MDAGNMSIEELYTQENVGTDKFEPKIEEFKQAYSAKEIAKELGKTSKEVEQIRDKAFQKIRENPIMQKYDGTFLC